MTCPALPSRALPGRAAPFRAVATDLVTGRMVVFDSGELPVALRASMSVPGAFAAVEQDGMLLVDGGISRNLPVDVARDTCADVVIAVAVDGPPPPSAGRACTLSDHGRSRSPQGTSNSITSGYELSSESSRST